VLTRRDFAGGLALGASALSTRALAQPTGDFAPQTLGALAGRRGCLYGCAATTFELRDHDFAPLLAREAKILVPEYEMKRAVLEPRPGAYDFDGADALSAFAQRTGMQFRGHTLVWHKANPPWLGAAIAAKPRDDFLVRYIHDVMSRYRGRVASWDVVNEALAPEHGRRDAMRESLWLRAYGPDYIQAAFHAARAADPAAQLVYNDWGCEADGPKHDLFRAATLDFLERMKARGVPIDAYGMQGHLQAFGAKVDQRKLRIFLERLDALGLRILVTEHDVDDSGGPTDVSLRDRAVADASRRFLDVVLDNRATTAVLTWGLSDRFLDPPGLRARLAGYSPRLLPLDSNLQRKPMWWAMAGSFSGMRPSLAN